MASELICAVSGSTGYVGSCIADALAPACQVVPLTRRTNVNASILWDFTSARDISVDLRARGVKVLVHAAWDMKANSAEELRNVCVRGSAKLFEMARRGGVERLVFISSISAFDGCRSAYGQSKLAVEQMVREQGGIIVRPGLVHGARSGGMFGTLRKQVQNSKLIPLIGDGRSPQYLLDEQTLGATVLRAAAGEFDRSASRPVTLAHPQPWPFRDLVEALAAEQNRQISFLPVPWRLLYGGLRFFEALRFPLPVRSDSVLSFVYQNLYPDFSQLAEYRIDPVPYKPQRL